jgi:hypothetical protein
MVRGALRRITAAPGPPRLPVNLDARHFVILNAMKNLAPISDAALPSRGPVVSDEDASATLREILYCVQDDKEAP